MMATLETSRKAAIIPKVLLGRHPGGSQPAFGVGLRTRVDFYS